MMRKTIWGALQAAFTLSLLMKFLAQSDPPYIPPSESNCMTDSLVDLVHASAQVTTYGLIGAILGGCSTAACIFSHESQERKAMAASFIAPLLVGMIMVINVKAYPSHEAAKLLLPFSIPLIWTLALFVSGIGLLSRCRRIASTRR
ncbi:hypothetical protein [Capsulimonas corticalis]|uniref:hypothetical protein n=1 Tax=Capsulimonas corticalis TaxID=2219043 RepID=UPI000E645EDB|nr:hypothetical protein [Capsulimonas corticalis]